MVQRSEHAAAAKRKRDRDRRNAARRADPATKEYVKILRKDPCSYPGCKNPAETVDHVIPFAKGGRTHWSNSTGMCRYHNQKKGKKSLLHFLLGAA